MSQRATLRGFLINTLALALLLSGMWTINYLVDPYNANRTFDVGVDKRSTCSMLSYYDWILARYQHERAPTVMVGDSRLGLFEEELLSGVADERVMNLAAGGARWKEVLSMAHFVLATSTPGRMVVQLNVDMLNGTWRGDRVKSAADRLEDPLQYYLNPVVSRASLAVLLALVLGGMEVSESPPMNKSQFWQWQLDNLHRVAYLNWTPPLEALRELTTLISLANSKGVEILVVMMPVHSDLRSKLDALGYKDENDSVRAAIREIAPLLDFDRDSNLTTDRSRFSDPFHLEEQDRSVLLEIFGRSSGLGTKTVPTSSGVRRQEVATRPRNFPRVKAATVGP